MLRRRRARSRSHDAATADFWAHLRAAPVGVAGWRWTAERRLRALALGVHDPRSRRWHPCLPDGYFEVEYAAARPCGSGGPDWGPVSPGSEPSPAGAADTQRGPASGPVVQCAVLEVDMGTLPLARFRRKARAFELAFRQGVFARAFGRAEFEVLVLARDKRRLEQLQAAARREVAEERWAWWSFATLGVLDPARFGGCAWLTLAGSRTPLLYDSYRTVGGD